MGTPQTPQKVFLMKRDIRIDSLRGLLLVWMTFNHMGGPLSDFTLRAVGFFSSVSGFVFISGLVAGMVYSRIGLQQGSLSLRRRAFSRALTIYLFHLTSFIFVMILEMSITNERYTSFFQEMNPFPMTYLISSLGLGAIFLLQPILLDILPMYCLFLLITPFIINRLINNHAYLVLLGSILVWSQATHDPWHNLQMFRAQYPPLDFGYFNPFAWQLPFIGGLFLGFRRTTGKTIPIKKSLVVTTILIWMGILLVRYEILPSVLFGFDLLDLTLRETFGPLRVINLLCVAYLITCIGTQFPKLLEWPWFSYLGQHSLQVFTFHLVLLYMVLPLYDLVIPLGWWVIILFNVVIASLLTIPAWLHVKYREFITPATK
jgi:hypothetical protein